MNPYLRWAILLFITGGLAFYYRKGSSKIKTASSKPILERVEQSLPTKKSKQRKPKKAPQATSASGSPTPTPQVQLAAAPPTTSHEKGEGMSNLEFAKQFSKVREGNAIAPSAAKKPAPAPKPVSRPTTGRSDAQASTSASSMTGADADDDLSSIGSSVAKPAGDVSDMLETPVPGASVLRVTGSVENEQKSKKNKKSNDSKPVETKKQRQQRIKKENNKRMIQEAEAQRRALLEKQLHSARDHERQEAAKSKPPVSNAWKAGVTTNGSDKPKTAPRPLLDTFKPTNEQKENISAVTPESWTDGLPPEEEQMRQALSESEWTTVSNKKKERRRANIPGVAMSDTSSSETPDRQTPQPNQLNPAKPAPRKQTRY
ncbi:predicted protein [Uncinocarpus reesii 1704]|uniref:Uncharacterized protein n=1 Tax=Uncinocarpus reesii (strain UAMH 1704) TaxID=336963 RepID=C4JTR5_UNCRE|nr:uncharacterized protein UREG_05854 [Uncinocarpus reesii 1704]EEP81012.1 predicted protein [Uncinocarpus reesii 1704]